MDPGGSVNNVSTSTNAINASQIVSTPLVNDGGFSSTEAYPTESVGVISGVYPYSHNVPPAGVTISPPYYEGMQYPTVGNPTQVVTQPGVSNYGAEMGQYINNANVEMTTFAGGNTQTTEAFTQFSNASQQAGNITTGDDGSSNPPPSQGFQQVAHMAPAVCREWVAIIPFVVCVGLILFYGLYGVHTIRLAAESLCNVIPYEKLGFPGPAESDEVSTALIQAIYKHCIRYFIIGKSDEGPGQCLTFAIDFLTNPSFYLSKRDLQQLDLQSFLTKREALQGGNISQILENLEDIYNVCVKPLSVAGVNVAQITYNCIDYIGTQYLNLNSNAFQQAFDTCAKHLINQNSEETAIKECAIWGISQISPTIASEVSGCYNDFSRSCFERAVSSLNENLQSNVLAQCVDPVINAGTFTSATGCLTIGISFQIGPQYSPIGNNCIKPLVRTLSEGGDISRATAGCTFAALASQVNDTYMTVLLAAINTAVDSNSWVGQESCLFTSTASLNPTNILDCALTPFLDALCRDIEQMGRENIFSKFSFSITLFQHTSEIMKIVAIIFIVNVGLALLTLLLLSRGAAFVVKLSIAVSIISIIGAALANAIVGNFIALPIAGAYLLFKIIWYICMRNDIKFVIRVLKVAMASVKQSHGVFLFGFITVVWQTLWTFICYAAFFKLWEMDFDSLSVRAVLQVLLALAYYWSFEVWSNVFAVTIASVTGSWYFYYGTDYYQDFWTVPKAVWRAMTYQFGSICLGSLIVAMLNWLHYLYRKAKSSNSCLKAIILFMLKCLVTIIETFNVLAFVQVGVYSKGYLQAARDTIKMIKRSGLTAVFNDDIMQSMVKTLRMAVALVLLAVTGVYTWIMIKDYNDLGLGFVVVFMLLAFVLGWATMTVVLSVVDMTSMTICVLFINDPHSMASIHPKHYEKLMKAWSKRFDKKKKFQAFKNKLQGIGKSNTSPNKLV